VVTFRKNIAKEVKMEKKTNAGEYLLGLKPLFDDKGNFAGKHPNVIFFNDVEAARLIGLRPQTLRNYRFRHVGPPYTKAGRSVRYRFDDLLSWMERGRIEPEAL
jgi:hypothetical protein